MCQRPGSLWQASDEVIDGGLLVLKNGGILGSQRRLVPFDQFPAHRRPHQEVHGHHFAEGNQVVVGAGSGEHRFSHTAEESLDQRFIATHIREQLFPMKVGVCVFPQGFAVADRTAGERFLIQTQTVDQVMYGPQHGAGHVVRVYLVAGHQQQCWPLCDIAFGFQ